MYSNRETAATRRRLAVMQRHERQAARRATVNRLARYAIASVLVFVLLLIIWDFIS